MTEIGASSAISSAARSTAYRQAWVDRRLQTTPAEYADSVREATFSMTRHPYGTPPPERTGKSLTEADIQANMDASEAMRLKHSVQSLHYRNAPKAFSDGSKPYPDGRVVFMSAESQALASLAAGHFSESRAFRAMYPSVQALNVDAVMRHADDPDAADPRAYAAYIKQYAADILETSGTVEFTGAMGTDRETTDVNEYLGWLTDAINRRAAETGQPTEPWETFGPKPNAAAAIINGKAVTLAELEFMAAQAEKSPLKGTAGYKPATVDPSTPSALSAVNVEDVMKLDAGGVSASRYGEYVRSQSEVLQASGSNFIFIGAFGSNRVTHDVEEYLGWLNDAVSKRAAMKAKVRPAAEIATAGG